VGGRAYVVNRYQQATADGMLAVMSTPVKLREGKVSK